VTVLICSFIHFCSSCHSLTHSYLSNSHHTSRYLTHSYLSNSHHTSRYLTHSYPSNSHHTSRYFLNGFIGGLAETGTTIVLTNKFADRLAAVTASIGTVAGIGCLAGPPLGGILYNIPSGGNAGDPWWVNTHTHLHLCSLVCPLSNLFSQHTHALEIHNSLARNHPPSHHPPSLFACLGSTRSHPLHLRTLSVGTSTRPPQCANSLGVNHLATAIILTSTTVLMSILTFMRTATLITVVAFSARTRTSACHAHLVDIIFVCLFSLGRLRVRL
jgi:MFS family permease